MKPEVWIRFEPDPMGGMYVIGDEGGEFGQAAGLDGVLHYVTDLISGPGTIHGGDLRERTVEFEEQSA